jgi:hypothetical protein
LGPLEGGVGAAVRGVVLIPDDFTLPDWPERIAAAGLTTLGLHHSHSVQAVTDFVQSEAGRGVLARCASLGIDVEYELHAMRDLLPRSLFEKNTDMFRMNSSGERTPDANCCVHSPAALEVVAENAAALCGRLKPTSNRYFLWGDDGAEGCRCPKCKSLAFSDQALILENHLLTTLRHDNPDASLAHLAYEHTYLPPSQVKPQPGIFLEFAPIRRSFEKPLSEQPEHLDALDANLAWFGAEGSQALEYWIDASLFSHWVRPCPRMPDRTELIRQDAATYRARGVQNLTSFGVMLDAEYVELHGEMPLAVYGAALGALRPSTILPP